MFLNPSFAFGSPGELKKKKKKDAGETQAALILETPR